MDARKDGPVNITKWKGDAIPTVEITQVKDYSDKKESTQQNEVQSGSNHDQIFLEEEHVLQNSFRAGSIHEHRFRKFWKNELQASPWVIDTLARGYKIPFEKIPSSYEEENNASARDNMKIVKQIVAEMIESNVVKVVRKKPKCVSPLGLVSKRTENGDLKHRLVFDASRWINLHIKDQKVTLAHLEKALELTEKDDWQVIFDLKSAYYHIKICEEDQDFLGAAIRNSDGSKLYFVYQHLPFGLKCAVHAITKIWKPITSYFQLIGIRSTIYIDDGRLLAHSSEQAEKFRIMAYKIIENAGWALERDKSDKKNEASRKKVYLGFEIDTEKMLVKKNERKLFSLRQEIRQVLDENTIPVKKLSSLIGKMASLIPSHGHIARFCTRSGYADITAKVDKEGWKSEVEVSLSCKKELFFFWNNILKYNGYPIKNELSAVRVDTILPGAKASKREIYPIGKERKCRIVSDASNFKAAVIFLDSQINQELEFAFTEEEKKLSSGVRELLAVQKTVRLWVSSGEMKNKEIFWATDSTNVVSFLEKGSPKLHIQDRILDIAISLSELNSSIQPIHLYREDDRIKRADDLSKSADSDDWSIDVMNFEKLKKDHNLIVDVFASASNARMPVFFGKFYEAGCAGVDAFAVEWKHGLWMCPPISLLPRVAKELKQRKNCSGILIFPEWPTASFYGKFFDEHGIRPPFKLVSKIEPYIYQNQGAKGALCGKVTFKFCVIKFSK